MVRGVGQVGLRLGGTCVVEEDVTCWLDSEESSSEWFDKDGSNRAVDSRKVVMNQKVGIKLQI